MEARQKERHCQCLTKQPQSGKGETPQAGRKATQGKKQAEACTQKARRPAPTTERKLANDPEGQEDS